MKKTLTALAAVAVAVSGSAMAEVSVTGIAGFGYKAKSRGDAAQTKASGLGFETTEINFYFKEDLGGDDKIEVKLGLAGADRIGEPSNQPLYTGSNGHIAGRDASLAYTNMSFGQLKLFVDQGGDYFKAVAGLDFPLIEMDGKLHETKSFRENISYSVPLGSVYLNVNQAQSGDAGLGLGSPGNGGKTSGNNQRNNTYSVFYKDGPLTLLGAYRTYNNQLGGECTATGCPALAVTKDVLVNLQAAYDLNIAQVGLGFQRVTATSGVSQQDMRVTVVAPLGPVTLASSYYVSLTADTPDTSKFANIGAGGAWLASAYADRTDGYSLGVKYALNKHTSILARYASWTHSGYSRYEADAPYKVAALRTFSAAAGKYFGAKAAYDAAPSAATGAALQTAGSAMQAAWGAANAAGSGLTNNNRANEYGR